MASTCGTQGQQPVFIFCAPFALSASIRDDSPFEGPCENDPRMAPPFVGSLKRGTCTSMKALLTLLIYIDEQIFTTLDQAALTTPHVEAYGTQVGRMRQGA
jgi:hypothetical protein